MLKKLKDMSLEELWSLFPIILKEYNPDYPIWYADERENLLHILGDNNVCRINHIGSTSVYGLISKPTVDILLEISNPYDIDSILDILTNDGWISMSYNYAEKTLDLNKGYTPNGYAERVFHLHVKPSGDWDELYFRDYLRQNPDVARQYEILKLNLKEQFEYDRNKYTDAKTAFVAKYSEKARKEYSDRYLPD